MLRTATDPEIAYSQDHYGQGRQIRQRGSMAVAVHEPTGVVITVLLRQLAPWTDEDAGARTRLCA